MPWATIEDTERLTRISVDEETLESAQAMIELFADVVETQTFSVKNTRLLKMAVAYQAAWMTDHPDLFTHVDVTSINQDGIFYVQAGPNAYLLAPMARRAVARLSWKRNRNIKIRPSTNRTISKRYIDASALDAEMVDSYPNNTPDQDDQLDWDEL